MMWWYFGFWQSFIPSLEWWLSCWALPDLAESHEVIHVDFKKREIIEKVA
ncbi:MAG TPA: hypothetical protein VG848_06425 [Acetobacteraceae bacterium]|nr:hypothetical protein [Acetobacteraceae bacterium]